MLIIKNFNACFSLFQDLDEEDDFDFDDYDDELEEFKK